MKGLIVLILRLRASTFEYIQANEIRTLQGEMVKGLGECWIANRLFMLGVTYQYERGL